MVTPAGDFGVVSRMKGTKKLDHDWTAVVEDLALGIRTVSEGLVGPYPVGTRRVRASTEHRGPGPLPPGKLTASHHLRRPATL